MKTFLWLLGAATLSVAAYVILSDNNRYGADRSPDDLDEVGSQVGAWGTKQRVTGTGGQLGGKLKQAVGGVTGDTSLEGRGVVDEVAGAAKDAAGQAAHAVEDTIHDLKQ